MPLRIADLVTWGLLLAVALGVCFLAVCEYGSRPPQAVVSGPVTAECGQLVGLSSRGSSGELSWKVEGGFRLDREGGPLVARSTPGEILVTLTATRNGQSVSTPHTITVGSPEPGPSPGPNPTPVPPTPPGPNPTPVPPTPPAGLGAWITTRITSDTTLATEAATLKELASLYDDLASGWEAAVNAGAPPTAVEIRAVTLERFDAAIAGDIDRWAKFREELLAKKTAEGLGRTTPVEKFIAKWKEISAGFAASIR